MSHECRRMPITYSVEVNHTRVLVSFRTKQRVSRDKNKATRDAFSEKRNEKKEKKVRDTKRFFRNKGITNVMSAGSNGESNSLTVDERKLLAEAWAAAAKMRQRLSVYVHVGTEALADSKALAAHAGSLDGVSGIVAMTPVYFKPTAPALLAYLAEMAAAAPASPFWFYHFPDHTGVLPGAAHEFLELADSTGLIPTLMGIKFTDYNMLDFQLCRQVGAAPGKYNMLYGRDEMALVALLLGADAAVSSTIGYSPTLRDALSLWASGDVTAAALEKQGENAKLCSFFAQYESQSKNVQKPLMKAVGFNVGPSRLPKLDLSHEEASALKEELNALGLLDVAPISMVDPEPPSLLGGAAGSNEVVYL